MSYPAGGPIATHETKINFLGTFRGRAGIVADRTLLYVTGGIAVAHLKGNLSTNIVPDGDTVSNTHVGWTVGAGAEHALNQRWSVKLEYLYMDLGSETYAYGPPVVPQTYNLDLSLHVVRAGVNYRF